MIELHTLKILQELQDAFIDLNLEYGGKDTENAPIIVFLYICKIQDASRLFSTSLNGARLSLFYGMFL